MEPLHEAPDEWVHRRREDNIRYPAVSAMHCEFPVACPALSLLPVACKDPERLPRRPGQTLQAKLAEGSAP